MIQNLLKIGFFLFLISFQSKLGNLLACVFFFSQIKKWTKFEIIIIVLLIMRLFASCPFSEKNLVYIGNVIQISEKSILIENHGCRWQIVTQDSFILDDKIEVKGQRLQYDESLSFFGDNYKKIKEQKRIVASIYPDSIRVLESSHSLRGKIHQRIKEKNIKQESILLSIVLNQNTDQSMELLSSLGIQYNLFYFCLKKYFSLFFYPKQTKRISLLIFSFLTGIFHYPMAMVRRIVFELLSSTMSTSNLVGFYTILVYLFHPPLLTSLGFIFPIGLTLMPKSLQNTGILYPIVLQSFFFSKVNFISILGFRLIRRLLFILYLFGMIDILFGTSFIQYFFESIPAFLLYYANLNWHGKIPFMFFAAILIMIYTRIKKKTLVLITIGLFLIQVLGLYHPYAEVSFINVGQGDSILIRLPFNQGNILIDTGKQSSWNLLDSYLSAKGINKIHALIITHNDEDHSGNLMNIKNQYHIDQIIDNYQNEIKVKDLTIKILSPLKDYGNSNDNSLVLAFSINHVRFLLLGDITATVENDLIKQWGQLDFDVVKIAHHGSRYSTSMNLLRNMDFKYAIISVGSNDYGHPHKDVITRLTAYNKKIFSTKTSGDLVFVLTGFCNFVVSSAHEFDIINSVIE